MENDSPIVIDVARDPRGLVESVRPQATRAVADLLAVLAQAAPDEVVDLKARFCYPLASEVMCDLIGVPAQARGTILAAALAQADSSLPKEQIGAAMAAVSGELAALVRARRHEPGEDLATGLLAVPADGGPGLDGSALDGQQVTGTLLLLLSIGTETIVSLLTTAALALLAEPGYCDLVRTGRVSWSDAIDRALRAEDPLDPVARRPFRLGTDEPSFSIGIYHRLGRALAVLAAQAALPALFGRYPDLRLAVPAAQVRLQHTFIVNGRSELPVHLRGVQ